MATSFLFKENEVTTIAPANRYVPWNTGSEPETAASVHHVAVEAT
ncbi:hypothetical protein [Arthrobacter sp. UYEF21]